MYLQKEINLLRQRNTDLMKEIDKIRMKEVDINIHLLALSHFGERNQFIKTMEECAELIHALARYSNWPFNQDSESPEKVADFVIEELADVQIMLNQMIFHFGQERFNQALNLKTFLLKKRIQKEENEIGKSSQ